MAWQYGRVDRGISVNMTPMIDVVFLLIIFFMVVSQVVSSELEVLGLPRPFKSQATEFRGQSKLTISLIGDGLGGIERRRVGATVVADEAELRRVLMESGRLAKARGDKMPVVLRAERDIHFRHIRRVMSAIAEAQLNFVGIAAEAESSGGGG